jgi:hypothetical protein
LFGRLAILSNDPTIPIGNLFLKQLLEGLGLADDRYFIKVKILALVNNLRLRLLNIRVIVADVSPFRRLVVCRLFLRIVLRVII